MRRPLLLLAALGTAHAAAAHDFWVQPARFAIAANTPVPVMVQVGHGAARQRWGVANSRVASFRTVGPGGTVDRRAGLHLDRGSSDADLAFATPGTHIIVLTSTHAQSDLPAVRFNDYAATEGLTPILDTRARTGTSDRPGREIYSRRAKALVRVGAAVAAQPHVATPLGLTLEIVPERDPYALKDGEPLPLRILYEGKPLAGALVKLNNLDADDKPVAMRRSDSAGRTSFTIPRTGDWQLNVIWSKPLVGNPDADFDTTFSSLTFGFPRAQNQ